MIDDNGKVREKHALRKVGGYAGELKKNAFQKFADVFFEEDLPTVKRSLIREVVIPTIKDFIADIFIGGVERTLYGTGSRTKRDYSSRVKNVSSASWRSYYDGKRDSSRTKDDDDDFSFKDVVMRDRSSAQDLLDTLKEAIRDYKNVSVAELYEALDKESVNFTDNYYGWTDLSDATIRRVATGYWLDLPKPEQLR
jgi:hypothetical protein